MRTVGKRQAQRLALTRPARVLRLFRQADTRLEHNMDISSQASVLVIGAGIMGSGIAQVAALAGHAVMLYDTREGAAADAKKKLAASLDALVAKGKLGAQAVAATLVRIEPVASLDAACGVRLVVEAIVEDLAAKRSLFQQLESIVSADCVLATNTSSISVTAIANGLQHAGRLVGMHFFNPVPLMKLVEVVSGLRTEPGVAHAIFELSRAWGKAPVHARSTPGFIVNRIARPFYAEALALLHERHATPAVIDAAMRAAGFRMGPCELMDLIGHDVNFAVTNSVFDANFGDRRYVPSLVQQELVDGGLLGRKSGRGFYEYADGKAVDASPQRAALPPPAQRVAVLGDGAIADRIAGALNETGADMERQPHGRVGLAIGALRLWLTDGRCAAEVAAEDGHAATGIFDLPLDLASGGTLAVSFAGGCPTELRREALAALGAAGWLAAEIGDAPGLVVARSIAMLINEAADAVQQGVCDEAAADTAMKLGTNYPAGPFDWYARLGAPWVLGVLDALYRGSRSERYRASPWLQQRAWSPS